jgi:hypothetical protein
MQHAHSRTLQAATDKVLGALSALITRGLAHGPTLCASSRWRRRSSLRKNAAWPTAALPPIWSPTAGNASPI